MPTPITGLVRQMYGVAMSEGLSFEDIVAIMKLFEKWGDVKARSLDHKQT